MVSFRSILVVWFLTITSADGNQLEVFSNVSTLVDASNRFEVEARAMDATKEGDDDGTDVCTGTGCILPCLWWVAVLYFFWAQAEVCDEFFVPTIEVISDQFKIPEDVAGSTIMALGCNGPELFLNTIAIFNPSDIGIGAVIGGEVFNILILIGCALLATPASYMPLKVAKFSFTRDCLFYAYSIGLLWVVLGDGVITWWDGLLLLGSGAIYSTTVTMSQTMRRKCSKKTPAQDMVAPLQEGEECDQEKAVAAADQISKGKQGPSEGTWMSVRVQHDNRLLDRNRQWDERFIKLGARGLIIDTEVRKGHGSRTARGIVFDNSDGHYHHAGVVNQPGDDPEGVVASFTEDSAGQGQPDIVIDKKSEIIPARDFVSCIPPTTPSGTVFELQVVQRDATFGKLVRLEVDAKTPEMCERWASAIMKCMQDDIRAGLEHFDPSFSRQPSFQRQGSFQPSSFTQNSSCCKTALMEWLDWLRFPVRSLLKATIPDVHKPQKRRLWPVAFAMSMVWLAIFAFGVIEICDELHKHFGISTQILGFTVAAVGTSFPNVISCIAVSKQGRTGMAIANALGANIQNVFLALALPWTIQAFANGGSFALKCDGLVASVMWMFGTLALMCIIILAARCRMPRWAGASFLVIYCVYLTTQLGSEITHCQSWPIGC